MVLEGVWLDDYQLHRTTNLGVVQLSLGSPSPRAVTDNRPSDHGAVDATRLYGPRIIELTGQVWAATFPEFWALVDGVQGRLALGSDHTLRLRRLGDGFDLQTAVRVDSAVDMTAGEAPVPFVRFGVSLFCADPRLYSSTVTLGSYDPTDAGAGGLTFPLDFPLVFGAPDGVGSLSVDNEGTTATPPTFVVTGPVTNPIIDNDTTGLSIYTRDCALAVGETLTIDVRERRVLLSGTTPRPDLIDVSRTTWWEVRPGVNQLRMRGSGMASGQTGLQASFRSARI